MLCSSSEQLVGVWIVNCGIKNNCDPTKRIHLSELVLSWVLELHMQVRSKLSPILNDAKASLNVIAFASLSLGLIYVGSCNEEVAQSIIFALMDRSEALGPGLLYLGKQESVEATAEVSKAFNEKTRKYCDMTLLSCAHAGTGNVLKVQDLLSQCGEHLEKGDIHQGLAMLGLAMGFYV
ncbi:unnamed protein product [Arabis nemorensis]|uniref:RPN1 N-terminal domain-containing protein n=1 Tax=Arabis nemorensis TaxID=586526 RepID=A0A565C113_9BRAS|nr:unnamed protein product [Arabis nemorensis]